jgi:hypothetical protein
VQKTDYYSSRDLQSRLSYVPVPQPLAWMPLRSWHKESTDTNTRQRQTPCPHWPRYSKDVFPIEGNMIHDPVTHTITTPAMFSPSPMPWRRPPHLAPQQMDVFVPKPSRSRSRPTLLVIDTITVQYSEVPARWRITVPMPLPLGLDGASQLMSHHILTPRYSLFPCSW